MLSFRLFSNDAKTKIDPKIGPIHGVQPKPNAAPTIVGKIKLLL